MSEKPSPEVGGKLKFNAIKKIALGLTMLLTPMFAHAKISDWATNIGVETSLVVGVFIAIFGAVGMILVAIGIFSYIGAKKNRQPVEYQFYYIGGGLLLVILVPFISSLGESVTDEAPDQTIQQLLDTGN